MPEPTRSPRRKLIMAMVAKKHMTAAQVAELIGVSREAAYNILLKMASSNQVRKINKASQVFWGKYVAPPKIVRDTTIRNGTMTEPLSLGYMANPVRDGSMDAFNLKSRGFI